MFADLPFLDRIDAAREAASTSGMSFSLRRRACDLHRRLTAAGVALTGLNTAAGESPPANGAAAHRDGSPVRPPFDEALAYANALDVRVIHTMAAVVAETDRAAARRTYIDNLRRAASVRRRLYHFCCSNR